MGAPEPGWYDDGSGAMRWWDGTQWTAAQAPDPHVPATDAAELPPSAGVRPPRRRKAWIAVAVAIVAVAAIGVGSAILISRSAGTSAAGADAKLTESEPSAAAEEEDEVDDGLLYPGEWDLVGPAVEPANETERAAVAAVELYEQAWESEDCDAYMQSTTSTWRGALYIEDCEAFAQVSASLEDQEDELKPALIKSTGANSFTIGVVNTIQVDPASLPGDAPEISAWRTLASYHVEQTDGEWRVEEIHDLDDGREEWELAPGERAESDVTLSQWEKAIIGGDCDALGASTTEQFRTRNELDCAGLQAVIQERSEYCEMSMEHVDSYYHTKWDSHHDEIITTAEETCLYLVDADGNALDPPEEGAAEKVEFHLVYDGDAGRWLIDNVG
jgi:hypothetical protein